MNRDGEVAEAESLKPPPKMSDMMGGPPSMPTQQPIQQHVPQMPQMQQYSQPAVQPQPSPLIKQQPQTNNVPMNQPQLQNQYQHQQPLAPPGSGDVVGQMPPAPSAPNMFKMQKGRSRFKRINVISTSFSSFCFLDLKKSYVDILGNSGQTVSQPKDLAPGMQFFNPVQQSQQVCFELDRIASFICNNFSFQFYNPNDFN